MRTLLKLFVLFVIVAIAVGLGASTYWQRLHAPFKGYGGTEQFVDIPAGATTPEIGRRLVEAGVIADESTYRISIWWSGRARSLKAGEYRFDRPLTPLDVLDKIARGEAYVRRVTFPEGLTIAEMSKIYEMRGLGLAANFVEAARDVSLVRELDPMASDLEGYLFPETYSLPRGTPAARLLAMMVDRFKATYTEELRARAEAAGMTTRQVVSLASLVEKETGRAEERPMVAAVYSNRLRIRMPLQADPTVVYALQKAGRYDGNIRRDDLAFDSPYNTYKYSGLPPGPIASPGKASLEAALEPAAVGYLNFVSRNDGSHVFASTLAEHNRNVQKFQVEFFRQQRRGAAGRGRGAAADTPRRRR
jgi:UPF0755 protein